MPWKANRLQVKTKLANSFYTLKSVIAPMRLNKIPSDVPLPEIPRHTEEVIFGGLGLPVGFDQERLRVNLRAFERIRLTAGLGTVSIVAVESEAEPTDAGVTSIDKQGAATASFAGKRHRKPLASGLVSEPQNNMGLLCLPESTTVRLDNTEIESRIEESGRYKKGVFDATARAKYLNRAIKSGLSEASFDASFAKHRLIFSSMVYGAMPVDAMMFNIPLGLAMSVTGFGNNVLAAGFFSAIVGDGMEEKLKVFAHYRHSLFFGVTPDRWIMARGMLTTSKLVKARA